MQPHCVSSTVRKCAFDQLMTGRLATVRTQFASYSPGGMFMTRRAADKPHPFRSYQWLALTLTACGLLAIVALYFLL